MLPGCSLLRSWATKTLDECSPPARKGGDRTRLTGPLRFFLRRSDSRLERDATAERGGIPDTAQPLGERFYLADKLKRMLRAAHRPALLWALFLLGAQTAFGQVFFRMNPFVCRTQGYQINDSVEQCMVSTLWLGRREGEGQVVVDDDSASRLCRRAWSPEASRALSGCVRRLMFQRDGLGERNEDMDPESATFACQYAIDVNSGDVVQGCMRRMMFSRDGLGERRPEVSVKAAAYACAGTIAPQAPLSYYLPVCQQQLGEETAELMTQCVKRLMYRRQGLGSRRGEISSEAAAVACRGALTPSFPP